MIFHPNWRLFEMLGLIYWQRIKFCFIKYYLLILRVSIVKSVIVKVFLWLVDIIVSGIFGPMMVLPPGTTCSVQNTLEMLNRCTISDLQKEFNQNSAFMRVPTPLERGTCTVTLFISTLDTATKFNIMIIYLAWMKVLFKWLHLIRNYARIL